MTFRPALKLIVKPGVQGPVGPVGPGGATADNLTDLLDADTDAAFLGHLLFERSPGSNTVTQTVQHRLMRSYEASDFGIEPNTGADLTTKINNALSDIISNSPGSRAVLKLGPGTFHASQINGYTGLSIQGVKGATTIVGLGTSPSTVLVKYNTGGFLSDFFVRGLILDCSAGCAGFIAQGCDDWYFEDNEITGLTGSADGIIVQVSNRFRIRYNKVDRPVSSDIENQSILVTDAAQNTEGNISFNRCTGSGFDISMANGWVIGNYIDDVKFGGLIYLPWSSKSHDNVVAFNRCSNGAGKDTADTTPAGIESWAFNSVISNNICYNNSGPGISVGGQNCVVSANLCYDNGTFLGSGPNRSGIEVRYEGSSVSLNGGNSIITGNRCYDSGAGTQLYGYGEQGTGLLSGIQLVGNSFTGNVTADTFSDSSTSKIGSTTTLGTTP